jgi:3-hydroxyacyl-[acyl-carrier-protein] dehydratase
MTTIANVSSATQSAGTTHAFDAHVIRRIMPHRYHMMLLDRVAAYHPEERRVVGVKNLSQNDPIVQGHFPEHPVCPGSLLIEALAQASGLIMNIDYLRRSGFDPASLNDPALRDQPLDIPMTVLVDSKIRQLGVALPGEQVQLRSHLVLQHGEMCQFRVGAWVDEREIATGEILLAYAPYMS